MTYYGRTNDFTWLINSKAQYEDEELECRRLESFCQSCQEQKLRQKEQHDNEEVKKKAKNSKHVDFESQYQPNAECSECRLRMRLKIIYRCEYEIPNKAENKMHSRKNIKLKNHKPNSSETSTSNNINKKKSDHTTEVVQSELTSLDNQTKSYGFKSKTVSFYDNASLIYAKQSFDETTRDSEKYLDKREGLKILRKERRFAAGKKADCTQDSSNNARDKLLWDSRDKK